MPQQGKSLPAQLIGHLQHRPRLLPQTVAPRRQATRPTVPRPIQRHQMHALQTSADQVEGGGIVQPAMQTDDGQPSWLTPDLPCQLDSRQGESYFVTSHWVSGCSDEFSATLGKSPACRQEPGST